MIEKELKIRDFCGDYALDIPFADGSVNTIYFNSKRNAETVKHIIEVDGSKPNEATVCDMQEIKHGKWIFEKDICGCTWFICQNCHKHIIMTKHRLYPYCPFCGAKMDKEGNNAFLPCPFCGSKVTVENISPKDADEEMYMFECTNDNCASATCFGDYSTDRATAIKNWNKRVAQCITNAKIGTCTINIDLR